jgi:superfamily II DNA or RNA helicase
MNTKRAFTSRQRAALYLASQGECASCGKELEQGWHGDHQMPYSKGGATDVLNGQALCPTCNLRKGDTMLPAWTEDLRDWQKRAYYDYQTANKQNFLLVATPGAGKTRVAARIAHDLLGIGIVERVVVVCPSEHLKKQWRDSLAKGGIQIDNNWKNASGVIASDFHGVAVTYQQVASNPDLHRMHCRRRTLVIIDEVHHAGDEQSWGAAIQEAFEPATHRLLLSGTPFRQKGIIPYVTYAPGDDGIMRSSADFSYGYGAALRDDVCRPILFPSYQGTMEWESNFRRIKATFQDALPESEARRRLRTALAPDGEWIRDVLRDANQRLTELRANGHPLAAGLILCSDATHARLVADRLHKVTGEQPTIVLSEDDDASQRIGAFENGTDRWIVAVRMVSEGVDIPRLRVGVYATHWISELFFRQVVGRFVRVVKGVDEQSAFLYIPKEEAIVSFAQRIKEERDHELDEEIEGGREKRKGGDVVQSTIYVPIASEAQADDVIYDHQSIQQREIEAARLVAMECGVSNVPYEKIARMFRLRGTPLVVDAPSASVSPKVDTLREQKDKDRKLIKRLAAQLVHESQKTLDYQAVYTMLMQIDGVKLDACTAQQLAARVEKLYAWIKDMRNG